jgi:hypothetical protein
VKSVAEAYKSGSFLDAGGRTFGSSGYGDLGAMVRVF